MLIMVPGVRGRSLLEDEAKSYTACILTLMVAFHDGSIRDMSPIKWRTNQTWVVTPAQASKPALIMINIKNLTF